MIIISLRTERFLLIILTLAPRPSPSPTPHSSFSSTFFYGGFNLKKKTLPFKMHPEEPVSFFQPPPIPPPENTHISTTLFVDIKKNCLPLGQGWWSSSSSSKNIIKRVDSCYYYYYYTNIPRDRGVAIEKERERERATTILTEGGA